MTIDEDHIVARPDEYRVHTGTSQALLVSVGRTSNQVAAPLIIDSGPSPARLDARGISRANRPVSTGQIPTSLPPPWHMESGDDSPHLNTHAQDEEALGWMDARMMVGVELGAFELGAQTKVEGRQLMRLQAPAFKKAHAPGIGAFALAFVKPIG